MAATKPTKSEQLFSALADDTTITILVGEDMEVYKAPRSVLYSASPWFRAALDPAKFVEGREKMLKLPKVEEHIFADVIYWLYYGCTSEDWDDVDHVDQNIRCVDVWLFGDAYLMPALCNFAMRLLYVDFRQSFPEPSAIVYAFRNTSRGSALRRLFMEEVCYAIPDSDP